MLQLIGIVFSKLGIRRRRTLIIFILLTFITTIFIGFQTHRIQGKLNEFIESQSEGRGKIVKDFIHDVRKLRSENESESFEVVHKWFIEGQLRELHPKLRAMHAKDKYSGYKNKKYKAIGIEKGKPSGRPRKMAVDTSQTQTRTKHKLKAELKKENKIMSLPKKKAQKSRKGDSYAESSKIKVLVPTNKVAQQNQNGIQTDGKGVYGINPEDTPRYIGSSDNKFTCFDKSKQISFSAVNDDYCDCADGSDEPGTSACQNARFYCTKDKLSIPSSRVNDGICDCCDGMDEWKNHKPIGFIKPDHPVLSFVPCENRCS